RWPTRACAVTGYARLCLPAAGGGRTESSPVGIWVSIVRRIFPLSTLTQFFAAGTNQLRRAARSPTLAVFRSEVAFGMFPAVCSAFSADVLVNAAIQSTASALFAPTGTARSEPPRKVGIGLPATWL